MGHYIVDFCCSQKGLIVELDGGHHNEDQKLKRDNLRQSYLEGQGYRVIRFWNDELDANLDGVLDRIKEEVDILS